MKNWRKEFTNSLKELTKPNREKKEEFTDITQASTPINKPKSDKMEEIYSTRDKQVKYKRLTPLEAEAAAKKTKSAKEKLIQGEAEIALSSPEDNKNIVELTYEHEEGTVVSDEIIEDVEEIVSPKSNHNVNLEDVDKIDIDLSHNTLLKEYERQANDHSKHKERLTKSLKGEYEKLFGKPKYDVNAEKIVTKIPTYLHDSKLNLIVLKAGRFSDVVESEYDEYLKSNDPIISKRHDYDSKEHKLPILNVKAHKSQQKPDEKPKTPKVKTEPFSAQPAKKKSKVKKFFRILKVLLFSRKGMDTSYNKDNVFDYEGKEDAKQVFWDISQNHKKLSVQAILLFVMFALALCSLTLTGASAIPYSQLIYCGANLLILLATGIIARPSIINGLKPLRSFRGNCDTALSCAYLACLSQQIASMFVSGSFTDSTFHLYTTVITLAFTLSALGKMLMVRRIKSNFRFITANSPAYCVKTLSDDEIARKMLSGTTASKTTIAYQHPTRFLSDFLKISYAPDPSEELCGKLSPITLISSVFVAVMYGIISKTFVGALCAFAVMSCLSIPLCAMLAGNLPMTIFCKDALKHNAMISGYPSIRQFSECDALMVDACELYHDGCIRLNKIKNFAEYRVDDALLYAALVMKEAGNPLYTVLKKHIKDSGKHLPKVESVMYEDKLGLVGWVGGERVLVGNRNLLDRYNIYLEDAADESKFKSHSKDVTYIACSGQLVSMLVTTYTPDEELKELLYRSQKNGTCLVVSSTDCNITSDKIATDYELYFRTVKVLSPGFATTSTELMHRKEESSRAFLATRGKFDSLLHAINGAINFKHNLTIGIIIETFGLVLGVLLGATMVLYAEVSILGIAEVMLYMLFWSVATIVVQFIKRS